VVVEGLWVGVMLYADDMALLARSAEELQLMIDIVVRYSCKWRFSLSGKKSEILVVGAGLKKKDKWVMGDYPLKIVKSFTYLGVEFQRNGKWADVCKRLCEKAEKRVNVVIEMGMRADGFSVENGDSLWRSLIVPLLEYGCEVWEPNKRNRERIERVQKRAGKAMLGCSSKMGDVVVRGELGWTTMEGRREMIKLRFFGRLVRMKEDRVVRRMFALRWGQGGEEDKGWCGEVRRLLRKYNLEEWAEKEAWGGLPKNEMWKKVVETEMRRVEEEKWRKDMEENGTLDTYRRVKKDLEFEDYLRKIGKGARSGAVLKTKLRGGTNALRVSMGRQQKLERSERMCLICNSGAIEDEEHFVMGCGPMIQERDRMWSKLVRGSDVRAASKMRMMTKKERFEFVLGKKQDFKVSNKMQMSICNGLRKMYEVRKGCLYDDVF
jgi:hypothetical protein